jgi:DNA polymerase-3 subunit gamma/tau
MPDSLLPDPTPDLLPGTPAEYRVLARKYRPRTFADLVGQEAMVQVLANAFRLGRVAQAFMLTGIRGTGKTTTARIIAKGLNCTGPEGTGGPTVEPCGRCPNCAAIEAGRHVDVLEIDAASNTGVQNVRDMIIDTVAYGPTQGRAKVFIIDEVHMLSVNAFNALLKTLEEPPPHVKFILATTEIRKVPVTVLSRCQRFDLRRIEPEAMIGLLRRIAAAEGAQAEDGALALIARAAEGSARDATSLLDQAIAGGPATAEGVRAMLGLADRGRTLDLFGLILRGEAAEALRELGSQYADGADPVMVLRDLAEACHWVSVLKASGGGAEDPALSPDERDRGRAMAASVPMRALTRFWQMLLKALEEVSLAPNAMMAAEMAVIRLTHVADLPAPEDLVRVLDRARREGQGGTTPSPAPRAPSPVAQRPAPPVASGPVASAVSGGALPASEPHPLDRFARFEDVVALIRDSRDVRLLVEVETGVRLVSYRPGRIEFEPAPLAPRDLAQRLGARLQGLTGARWAISVVDGGGRPAIAEARDAEASRLEAEALAHPLVQAALRAFPQGRLKAVRSPEEKAGEAAAEALPEVPDEWDPFEE